MIEQIGQALVDNLPLLISASIQLFLGIVTGIIGAAPAILKSCLQLGVDIIAGILSGISDHIDEIWQRLLAGVSNAVNKIKKFLGIESPSKLFAEIGANTMYGLEQGINAAAPDALKAMEDATAAVSAAGVVSMALDGTTGPQTGIGGNVVYINGAQVNDTPGIQTALVDFLLDLKRLGVMEEGAIA